MDTRIIARALCSICFAMLWSVPVAAQLPTPVPPDGAAEDVATADNGPDSADIGETDDILNMDIEQLGRVDVVVPSMDIEVTSVTRTESTVGRSPAAIFVITPEMIRRSGATSVPELLRMVPGLEVARIDSGHWAVTARGFNSRFANKLLVQIDGRSVYSPIFAGVYWEANGVMLEDVERIEVIRGPGATVWGANAVNGVINIITKRAQDTQGMLVAGGAGNEERGFTRARYGGKTAGGVNWRVYGFQFDRDRGTIPGGAAQDDWRKAQGGFRADWEPNCCNTITAQGDYYNANSGMEYPVQLPGPADGSIVEDAEFSGGNALLRWSRDLGGDRGWAVQVYYDHFEHNVTALRQEYDVVDVDFQQQSPIGEFHELVWGGRYRYCRVRSLGSLSISYEPAGRDTDLFSYFLQDQITLSPEEWFLTVGSKFEHNDFSSFEFQPTARLLWSPDPRRAVWTAISRAVRTPAISDEGLQNKISNIFLPPFGPQVFVQLDGQRVVESEDVMAYEMGYRAQPTDEFSWDVAVFFNKYEDLIVYRPVGGAVGNTWHWPAANGMNGETYGGELSATWQVNPCWQVTGSYGYLQMALHATGITPPQAEVPETASPHSRVYMRSSWDLAYDLEFDLTLRYVDSLRYQLVDVPSYVTMDVRLGWRPGKHFEAAVVAQNLLDGHHYEFGGQDTTATQVDRGVYGTVAWRY